MDLKNNIIKIFILIYITKSYCCTVIVKSSTSHRVIAKLINEDSSFGDEFEDGSKSHLIESDPLLACSNSIDPPPMYLLNATNIIFVSLIKRGNCTFEQKVRAAQNSGFQGVIIYNNNSDRVYSMRQNSLNPNIQIPSIMVGLTSGLLLRNYTYISSRKQYIVIIRKNFGFDPKCYIIAFLGFVSLGFLIIGIVFAIKLGRDFVIRNKNRLKKSHLKKIPVKIFVKGEDNFDMCAICLEDFIDRDKLRILLCNHAYHIKCIDPWLLKQKRNCPFCKSRVRIPGVIDGSDENLSIGTVSDNVNSTVDEHTPLINVRDGTTSQFYFGDNENEINGVSEHPKLNTQAFYDNPCIDNVADNIPSTNDTVITAVNVGDVAIDDATVIVTSHTNDGTDDLTKVV